MISEFRRSQNWLCDMGSLVWQRGNLRCYVNAAPPGWEKWDHAAPPSGEKWDYAEFHLNLLLTLLQNNYLLTWIY